MQIKNKDQIKAIVDKSKISTKKYGDIVLFTNGNGWYIETLIQNLLRSIKLNDPDYDNIIVFCSDMEGYKKCEELKYHMFEYVDIPDLEVSKIVDNKNSIGEHYTRLTFVKIVLISYIIELGYTPVYLDPDMSFKTKSIDDLLSYLHNPFEFVCSGTPNYMNSNIMIVKPTSIMKFLFNLTIEDVDLVIKTEGLHSDEDFLRPRMKLIMHKIHFISQTEYPPGCDAEKYIAFAKIIHANCVTGLDNKIQLIKKCDAWFI